VSGWPAYGSIQGQVRSGSRLLTITAVLLLAEHPPLLLAIDELLALVMLQPPARQRAFWGLLAAFASRARKVGMGSIGLATDPTFRALGQGGLSKNSICRELYGFKDGRTFVYVTAAIEAEVSDDGGSNSVKRDMLVNGPNLPSKALMLIRAAYPIEQPFHAATLIFDKWCILMYHMYMRMYAPCIRIHRA
jgi:hypothetical protein